MASQRNWGYILQSSLPPPTISDCYPGRRNWGRYLQYFFGLLGEFAGQVDECRSRPSNAVLAQSYGLLFDRWFERRQRLNLESIDHHNQKVFARRVPLNLLFVGFHNDCYSFDLGYFLQILRFRREPILRQRVERNTNRQSGYVI